MKKPSKFIGNHFEAIMLAIVGISILTVFTTLTVMTIREYDFVKCVEANCVVKAANEHGFMYYHTESKKLKTTDDGRFYQTHYIGYDEYHTYYSIEYLTATRDYEIIQTIELNIFINPLYN